MAGLRTPLSTLRIDPRQPLRMTRGRCGSLNLHRKGLTPSTSCRSPGAPVQPISWYDRYQSGGPEALDDRSSRPNRVWNRIPDDIRVRLVQLALDEPALSRRGLAMHFTDTEKYFVSEASVHRLLKAHDLIASPAFIVMKAADEFKDKTPAPNEFWQTDFTYLKIIGWGWFYLSTVLDDFSHYINAWKLRTKMNAEDVTATLDLALKASGLDRAKAVGPGFSPTTAPATSRQTWPNGSMARISATSVARLSSDDPRQDRALTSDAQEPYPTRELLPAGFLDSRRPRGSEPARGPAGLRARAYRRRNGRQGERGDPRLVKQAQDLLQVIPEL